MALEFELQEFPPIILVTGIGGGGGNAISNMYRKGIHGVNYLICNTDAQALRQSPVPNKIQLGRGVTKGLGCGARPETGAQAARESQEEILPYLQEPTQMVFLTAGLGGGTGTGASPIIAEMCSERGLLTVGVVTLPFASEGAHRRRIALKGLEEIRQRVDTLIVIENDNIKQLPDFSSIKLTEAFARIDSILHNAVRAIAETITMPGYINLDFADVRTIMEKGGYALIGLATTRGENRAQLAVEEVISSPLLGGFSIRKARRVLVNITAHPDTLKLSEHDEVMDLLQKLGELDSTKTQIILGTTFNENFQDELSLVVIATDIQESDLPWEKEVSTRSATAPKPSPASIQPLLPLEKKPSPPAPEVKSFRESLSGISSLSRAEIENIPAYDRYKNLSIPLKPPTPRPKTLDPAEAPYYFTRRENPHLHDNAD